MIKLRKQSYFDKYLDIINTKSRTLKKYGYYIKIPAKYDIKFWLLAALKRKLFDIKTPKTYYNLAGNEASEGEIQRMHFGKHKGGILIFATDLDITKKYAENFHNIFHNRTLRTIFQKYGDDMLWCFGRRYRGVYNNKPRNKNFNATSNTLEILGLNSLDLINVGVKLAVQLQQSIILIKDLNNEQMVIVGKNIENTKIPNVDIDFGIHDEITDFDIAKLEVELDNTYKLCKEWQHNLWEIGDIYPRLHDFWIKDGCWYGK